MKAVFNFHLGFSYQFSCFSNHQIFSKGYTITAFLDCGNMAWYGRSCQFKLYPAVA